ncbi:MAG: TraK family protein [Boseongicola sp.]|nr:TraK family protein [Boseongicola sp.]
MEILFHLGAHCTDDGLLIRSILRNRAQLASHGIVVPGPGRYRELIGSVSTTLRGDTATDDTEAMLIEAISDDDTAARIVLSNENFLCRDKVAIGPDGLYPKADKSAWLRRCFPSYDVDFAIGLRNPATFVPALLGTLSPQDRDACFASLDLEQLSWADVIAEILEANPDATLTLWAHEDTPYIWSEIMREVTGHDPCLALDGANDMLSQILSTDGMARLQSFLNAQPDISEARRRKAVSAFLEAHAVQDEIEEEIDLPGWTLDTIAHLTDTYEDEIERIKVMPRVNWLEP